MISLALEQPPQVHQQLPSAPPSLIAWAFVAFAQPPMAVGLTEGMFERSISLSHCLTSGESRGGIRSSGG